VPSAKADTSGPSTVIAGLDPAIHPLPQKRSYEDDGPAGQARG
jgi:hypothetical protein